MTYDNTDERGEDAVARQRGGSEPGHLPECPAVDGSLVPCACDEMPKWTDGGLVSPEGSGSVSYADHVAALRACEARVSTEYLTPMALAATGMSDPRYAKGYAAALDAARDAVAAVIAERLDHYDNDAQIYAVTVFMATDAALAAIDALRGES